MCDTGNYAEALFSLDPVLPPHQISRCQDKILRGATISETQAKPNTKNVRWDIWDIKTSETKKKKKDSFCHGSKFIPYYSHISFSTEQQSR